MIKLFDSDSYISEFSATVTACEKADGVFNVTLDQTAFFPTAGGQECDSGTLAGDDVVNVEIKDGVIYHAVEKQIEVGSRVVGKINMAERFRKMQHHSAEHIVSGLAHSLFGLENTGFHLGDRNVTIDYGGEMTEEELLILERKANETIWKNLKITAEYPPKERLAEISYRSKLDLSEDVRIVTIDGVDVCACCAPHVRRTGEIGLIKLKNLMRHRGGVRLKMICGDDALRDYEEKYESISRISELLSAKKEDTPEAVAKLLAELGEEKRKSARTAARLAEEKAAGIMHNQGNICIFEENFEPDALMVLATCGKEKCGDIFAALSGNDEDGYSYVITSKNVNLAAVSREINTALSGRGGGHGDMLRGIFRATREEISAFFHDFHADN